MKSIALVTYCDKPHGGNDDMFLEKELICRGYTVSWCVWDDPSIRWETFDAIILRSTWDYHLRINEFSAWLTRLERLHVRLYNPYDVVRWNMDKRYLFDLEKLGIHIPKTYLMTRESDMHHHKFMQLHNIVIKPVYGASSYGVKLFTNIANHDDFERCIKDAQKEMIQTPIFVQEYIDGIETDGEYSFLFYGNTFSHAVKKMPKKGEFLTQPEFGGKEHTVIPSEPLLHQAKEIIQRVHKDLLYVRLDAIDVGGNLTLMELECIEPFLFFEFDPQAPARFADALGKINIPGII